MVKFNRGMKRYALIVGAGRGTRMGGEVPKQFLVLHGRALIWYSIRAFTRAYPDIEIILVLPEDQLSRAEALRSDFSTHKFQATAGGETRFDSVRRGLEQVNEESMIFVHDAVRSMVSVQLIRSCGSVAEEKGNAVPAVAPNDSLRLIDGETNKPIERERVRIVQTPQVFPAAILKKAFQQPFAGQFTDEASVVEASGVPIFLVEGEKTNIKITDPKDLYVAEKLLRST